MHLALFAVGLLPGCAGTQLYEGEKLPDSKVARISVERPAKISRIDGEPVSGRRFELLPGRHSLDLSAEKTISGSLLPLNLTEICSVALDLSAGEQYVVRGRFDRERLDEPKAPYGSVTRYTLTLDLTAGDDSISTPALECSDTAACLILWKHGRYNETATCPQYDKPTFSFRRPDSDKAVPVVSFHPKHCEELDEIERPDCYLKAGDKVLLLRIADGSVLLFVPRDSASASVEERDAAKEACGEIGPLPALTTCLSDHGYVLQE